MEHYDIPLHLYSALPVHCSSEAAPCESVITGLLCYESAKRAWKASRICPKLLSQSMWALLALPNADSVHAGGNCCGGYNDGYYQSNDQGYTSGYNSYCGGSSDSGGYNGARLKPDTLMLLAFELKLLWVSSSCFSSSRRTSQKRPSQGSFEDLGTPYVLQEKCQYVGLVPSQVSLRGHLKPRSADQELQTLRGHEQITPFSAGLTPGEAPSWLSLEPGKLGIASLR